MALHRSFLTQWMFATGDTQDCLSAARPVHVPHTWNIEAGHETYTGKGWYRLELPAGTCSAGERAFLRFRGAYRDTTVMAGCQTVLTHFGSGYTPFEVEITPYMTENRQTEIVVCVDNSFSHEALPYDRSFDWANDGGLIRPVELCRTGPAAIRDVRITARPEIPCMGRRQTCGAAFFGFRVWAGPCPCTISWALYRGADDSVTPLKETAVISGTLSGTGDAELVPFLLDDVVYWHFDRPELYTLVLRVYTENGSLSDTSRHVIGFRQLRVQGETWFFNGEAVRLPGMEWMPGSDPSFGMAEPRENLEKMLCLLKESNSVLTRFHWQQDDAVYDYCDRHGILVQEEIPFWGKQPEGDPDALWPAVSLQLTEMIHAHRHHPSIISWGVGNELSAQTWPVQHYIRRAVALAHALDPDRLSNYVTNTAFQCPRQDGTCEGDVLMINDYIGTWHEGFEQESAWHSLTDAHPGRVLVPSEYGLCEPAFPGGDPRREAIFLEKMASYRRIPAIAGTIYFCLNDYRTHMGEEGNGKMRRRVHGSADMLGRPKPSYFTVRKAYAPLEVTRTENSLVFQCRSDLPSYTVSGYLLKTSGGSVAVPDLAPGESWTYTGSDCSDTVSVFRPDGTPVLSV